MHELSIVMSLLDVAGEELERQGGGRVLALHLTVGPLAGVVREALASAFEQARAGSAFEGCRLVIQETPILIDCATCGAVRAARSIQDIRCDHCGAPAEKIVGGRELELTVMELSEAPADGFAPADD